MPFLSSPQRPAARYVLAALGAALALVATASAQQPKQAKQPPAAPPPAATATPPPPTAPTPTIRTLGDETRGGWRTACKMDVRQFCRAASGGKAKRECLQVNTAKTSRGCQASLVERKTVRKDVRRICRADLLALCKDAAGGKEELACLRQKTAQLTPVCGKALAATPAL